MGEIEFVKMSGVGNDFVIIDARKQDHSFTPKQISAIANRKNIGCDQFILLKKSSLSDVYMEIYNSDGDIATACGNATRCVASIIMDEIKSDSVVIETLSGNLRCKRENNPALISVNMGKPKFDWKSIPMKEEKEECFYLNYISDKLTGYKFSVVNVGNPHIVTFLNQDQLLSDELLEQGVLIENNKLFPKKINVEFAKVIKNNHIEVRVWERGAGETLSCGSGACAVAILAIKRNIVNSREVKIKFRGGNLSIRWEKNGDIIMIGDYKKIFTGKLDKSFIK